MIRLSEFIQTIIERNAYNNGYEKMSICIVKGNDRTERIYTHLGAKHYKDFIDDFEGPRSIKYFLQ